ncbi:MAG: gas vesicle protein [Actinomycetota bacterium]|nr:gas vesicle protein [Actinomycetota bacterium]
MPEQRGILGADTSGTSLVDLLDRVLQRGAYISGDVTICLAGIDLARLDLRLLLTGIEAGPVLEPVAARVIRDREVSEVPA